MKDKIVKKKQTFIENPYLFFIVLGLLIFSLALLTLGLLRRKVQTQSQSEQVITEKRSQQDDSVSQYFEEEFAQIGDVAKEEDIFIKSDPFKGTCGSASQENPPSISGYTICYR